MPDLYTKCSCAVCGKPFSPDNMTVIALLRPQIVNEIEADFPDLDHGARICKEDLAIYRTRHIQNVLVSEKGELSHLEEGVIESLRNHDIMSTQVHKDFEGELTLGQRLADRIATFGGSWTFLITFFSFLLLWITVNLAWLVSKPFDPYPFILLNLLLSCLAAIQAPVIMMSQNRKAAKDRVTAEHDYQVNLKAELEIRHLHEKMDHLLLQQWERLVDIQQVQIELIEELGSRKKKK